MTKGPKNNSVILLDLWTFTHNEIVLSKCCFWCLWQRDWENCADSASIKCRAEEEMMKKLCGTDTELGSILLRQIPQISCLTHYDANFCMQWHFWRLAAPFWFPFLNSLNNLLSSLLSPYHYHQHFLDGNIAKESYGNFPNVEKLVLKGKYIGSEKWCRLQ